MKINIDKFNENIEESKKKFNSQSTFCFLSFCRLLAISCTLVLILLILIFCKIYIKFVLLWLEKQNSSIIVVTICCLFIVVSLPISIGYILLVVASGYLFGMVKGLTIVICGANFGLLIAHNVLKVIGHSKSIYRFVYMSIYYLMFLDIITTLFFSDLSKMIWQMPL